MAPIDGRPKGTPTIHRDTFLSIFGLTAIALMLVGCASAATSVPITDPPPSSAPDTPVRTDTIAPTSTPAREVNIGQQVIDAVQKTGLVTVVNTTVDSQIGDESQQESIRAWLDFSQQRVRTEGWLNGEPSSVSVVVDGTEARYDRGRNQIDEYPVRFFGMSPEEAEDALPAHLSNPALLGLVPLSGAMVHTRGNLRPMGEGQWQGSHASVWESDYAGGPEGYDRTRTTIYLEPETLRPLGQEVRFTSKDSQAPEIAMSVTYWLDFVSLENAPRGIFTPGRVFHSDAPEPTPLPAAGSPPPPLPTVPRSNLPTIAEESSLLQVMEKLPASFGEEGVWFADYGRAWELAGLPPQPTTVERFIALSDEEKEAYQAALRGMTFGPSLLLSGRQYVREWEDLFGFSGFGVSLAVGSGQGPSYPFGTAYLEGDIDPEDFGQRLLDLGYRVESVDSGSYYAIGEDRNIDMESPTRRAGVMARMNRVFLAEGILAAGPDTDPIVELVAASSGNTPVLSDNPANSRLAASLADPLSAGLLPRSAVLEPQGRPHLGADTYEKPEDWGEIHPWEALGSGYTVTEGSRWWGISLYYPDPEAAEADAGELVGRMNGYQTAMTPMMFPNMSDEGLAAAAERPYVINDFCTSLTPVYTSDEAGSILTVWCQISQPNGNRWHTMMDMGDLGFLLP